MKAKLILMFVFFSTIATYAQSNKERGYTLDSQNDHNPQIDNGNRIDNLFRMKEVEAINTKIDICIKNGNDFVQLKKYDEAISEYTKAIIINDKFSAAYYNRGLVEAFVGQKEKGCADLRKAEELGEKDAYSMIQKYCK